MRHHLHPSPRSATQVLGPLLGLLLALNGAAAQAFGFEDVAQRAQQLAAQPYAASQARLPAELKNLDYDQARDIRFKPARALWRQEKLPFETMFFHLGHYQTEAVRINEVVGGHARAIPFRKDDFDYGKNKLSPQGWGDIGYAGFRVHYPLNNDQYKDELLVFQGASYFRALGAGQHYGLSARGLAIDTVGGKGEEFPRFTEFWIERPATDSKTLTIHALLDSKSATGAYQFLVRPGAETVIDVKARVFLRQPVATLALAPLTSMYLFGENQPQLGDFRPEVHDSDGLMVASSTGEWIWRPLINPKGTFTTSFSVPGLRGFGLMQRDRKFANYEDVEARYDKRPSSWIEPLSDWGPGRVELMQLHTPDETHDNIVAYWVPAKQPAPGQPLDFAYRLHQQGDAPQQRPPGAWTSQTRTGYSYAKLDKDETQYIVDFEGPSLKALPADAKVVAQLSTDANGRVTEANAYPNPATGGWRMTARVKQLRPGQPTELRGFLQHESNVLTETWSLILPPQ
ncbi:glucan biosynthesis protein G [Roseateles amylovorans]|uniref:Glucans biosynthesis protein G n=1 Tax=Roseateles amylovorans TaxID=2978473 RepID=A0ABY6B2M2_9BURK|nr:glucan biosynthesis protein G [Roseateles amylovorans]UXH78229.1 glucan biosynthesis protein G [Roseateles amylovorans]